MPNNVFSTTGQNLKDEWRTPKPLFNLLNEEFNFVADLAATYENHLCETFSANSLEIDWLKVFGPGSYFINPPFSKLHLFLKKAYEEYFASNGLITVVMLYNYETLFTQKCLKAFGTIHERTVVPGEIRVLIPRLNYVHPKSGRLISGVNFTSCVHIFGYGIRPRVFFWNWRKADEI